MPKGELTRRKRFENMQRNKDAIAGKLALIATYEQFGKEPDPELLDRLKRLRLYLKARTGETE